MSDGRRNRGVLPLTTRREFGAGLAALLVSSACGGSGGGPGGRRTRIALLPKKKGVPYFTSCAGGAGEAARELNVELLYDGPTDGSPEKAAATIEKWTLQRVDAIAVSPNDPDVLAPAMREARRRGVRLLTWDADAAADTREFFVNQATYRQVGHALVDALARALGGPAARGDVAIVTAALTAFNQNQWMIHMKERLTAYPGLRLVTTRPSDEDQKLAFAVTQDLLRAYPNLVGIFAISSVAFPAAAEAVRQAGRSGKVPVVGLATPNDMRSYVEDGTVPAVVLWNTVDLGYLTIHAASQLVAGTLKAGATSIQAGRLGTRPIEGDQILLGGIQEFTKENIGQFNF